MRCLETFSILNRIDIPATTWAVDRFVTLSKLSVSSTGSISLQPLYASIEHTNGTAFSILNRIDIPATYYMLATLQARCYTFSILNRIDIPATNKIRPAAFEYPNLS